MSHVYRNPVLTVSVLVLLATAAAGQEAKAPKLVLSQTTWNFGEVWHEEKPVMTLKVRNEGEADLRLINVRTTCGCTAAQPTRRVVPPGESADIRVQYDTQGKQGQVSSKVIITSNDAFNKQVNLVIKGFVKRAITRKPLGGLVIRTLDGSPGQTGNVILENQLEKPMKLELRQNGFQELDVRIQEIKPGLQYAIIGRTNRPLEPGIIRGVMEFTTGLEREPVFKLHAKVQVYHSTEASPAALQVPKSNLDQAFHRRVDVYHYGKQGPAEFRLTGFKCEEPDVVVRISDTLPPKNWQLRRDPKVVSRAEVYLKLPPPNEIPEDGIVVELMTSDPERPKLEVLITKDKKAFERIMYGHWSGRE